MSRSDQYSRPEFMTVLGLTPPCTEDDIKQAFRGRVRQAHPDGGGDSRSFIALRTAYEEGLEYARMTASRMDWLSGQVDKYLRRIEVIERIESLGGSADLREVPWITRSCGEDYSQVADKLVGVHLNGPGVTSDTLDLLVDEHDVFTDLELLDLSGSAIDDAALHCLKAVPNLHHLDITNTAITVGGLDVLAHLPHLKTLWLMGTPVSWWTRWRLRRRYPELEVFSKGASSRSLLKQR